MVVGASVVVVDGSVVVVGGSVVVVVVVDVVVRGGGACVVVVVVAGGGAWVCGGECSCVCGVCERHLNRWLRQQNLLRSQRDVALGSEKQGWRVHR